MNIEAFIESLDTQQSQTALDLLWRKLSDSPQDLSSPSWHGEVLAYREANPSDKPKMSLKESKEEVKRMVDERRNS